MELALRRFIPPRLEPIPDSLTMSVQETARIDPRGELPPLPPSFDELALSPEKARAILVETGPSTRPTTSEVFNNFRTQVHEQQLATDAGKAFLADHPDTLQTFRLERRK